MAASVRNTIRQFRKSPGFTAAAVLTLALGIGGTTAIFTLIDAVMFRPLPVPDPSRLYRVGDGDDTIAVGRHGHWGFFSYPLFERLKAGAPEFENITAFDWGGNPLSIRRQGTDDGARVLRAEYVTGSYFATLGAGAFRGRVLNPDDDRPPAPPVLVLSHAAWQGVYAADPSVVGSTLVVEGHPFIVIGVAAPEFFGETVRATPPDLWIPLQQEPAIAGDGSLLPLARPSWLAVIGRLRRDASIVGVAPRLTVILRQWIQYGGAYPSSWMPDIMRDLPRQTIAVVPAGAGIGMAGLSLNEQYGPSLRILLAICGLVLAIACANVANLLLARSVTRRAQTAVRLAIGATPRQVFAEALVESVLLALAGGLAGLLVATGATHFAPFAATTSLAVLVFAAGLSVATGIVFGAAPAWFRTRTDPMDALRGSGRGTGRHSSRARGALLIVQAALAVVLVAGSTMLARSLANLERQNFGYPVQGRVMMALNRLPSTYTPDRLTSLYRDIEQRLADLPGVRGCGLALYNPLSPASWHATIRVAGRPAESDVESAASFDRVSAGYLQNLGVTLLRGRWFSETDDAAAAPVAVVNEAFVKRFFSHDEDPIGQHFGVERPENAATFRIAGIVRDAKFARSALNQPPAPMFFLPLSQTVDYPTDYLRMMELRSHFVQGIMLVTGSPPGDLEPLLRRTLAKADPNLTITDVATIQQRIGVSFDRERSLAGLAGLFGIVALLLAAVGVYGVTAYMVAQQTSEIGIRMALGADRAAVIGLVLRRAFRHAAAGLALGLPLAIAAAKFLAAHLYGVSSWDPFALAMAAWSLAASAFLAAIIPAVRAAALSPMSALRTE